MVPVFVESNPSMTKENALPNCPSRWAPFYIYDCLKPLGESVTPMDGTAGLYISFAVPAGAVPGDYAGSVEINCGGEKISVAAAMKIYDACVPAGESLKIIIGYSSGKTAEYHKVPSGSAENKRLDVAYLKMLRHMRQNMLYTGGVRHSVDANGIYVFDFSALEDFVASAMKLGFRYFNAPSVGRRKSWQESTILVGKGLPSMSYEAYRYLSQYLPALRAMLARNGWLEKFYMGVADEPNGANATEFRALCGLVRKYVPDIRLIDAVSYVPIHGALDVWVPLNAEYAKHRAEFESFRGGNDEIWHYVCCCPRAEGYINRFLDYPLLSTRYLFWGNYKYNLGGFLHWAANVYQPGQDPFTSNCPRHTNCDATVTLPPGDTHIIYPGDNGPWMSMRLEAQRESAEEYELLRMLAHKDKAHADRICAKCFRSFNDVEYDPVHFIGVKTELLQAVAQI